MRLLGLRLHHVEMPLVAPFTTSFMTQTHKRCFLVEARVETASGDVVTGWGENVALDRPFYSPEHVDGAAEVVEPAKPHATLSRAYVARPTEQARGALADRSTRSHQPSRGSTQAMAPREVASAVLAARGMSLPAAARSGRPAHPAHPHAR